jgi:hypothetical protein
MDLPLASFSYGRSGSGLPESRLVNFYPELTPQGPGRWAAIQRPGLVEQYAIDTGPVTAIFSKPGVFGGDVFQVSGAGLYRGETNLGSLPVDPRAKIVATRDKVIAIAGGEAWCYYEITSFPAGAELVTPHFEQVAMPDNKAVTDAFVLADRVYYLIEDDDEWYFSDIDDPLTVDSLAFATADSAPDENVGGEVLGDQAVFFQQGTVEFWSQTGDQDAPLVRSQGVKYDKGCVSARSIVAADNRLWWVGDDLKVYATGPQPERVSSHAIEYHLRRCNEPSQISQYALSFDGHDVIVLNVPGEGSFALHIESQEWATWASYGEDTFRGYCGTMAGSVAYIGDGLSGRVFIMDPDALDDAGDPLERVVSFVVPRGLLASVELDCSVGAGVEAGTVPLAEFRYSDNKGRDWTDWREASIGAIGDFDIRPRWTRLGLVRVQRQGEIRITDPVRVSVAGVRINEPL